MRPPTKRLQNMSDVMGETQHAFQRASDLQKQMAGKTMDPDVALYEKMKPDDFNTLVMTFGLTDTEAWINKVEAKRHGVGK